MISFTLGNERPVIEFLAAADPSHADAHAIIDGIEPLSITRKYDLFSVEMKGPNPPKALAMASAMLLVAIQVQYMRRHVSIEPVHFMASYFRDPATSLNLTFTNFQRNPE